MASIDEVQAAQNAALTKTATSNPTIQIPAGQTQAQANAVSGLPTGTNPGGVPYGSPNSNNPAPPVTVGSLYYPTGSTPADANPNTAASDAAKLAAQQADPAYLAGIEKDSRASVLSNYQEQLSGLDQAAAEARARITTAFAPIAAGRVGSTTALEARRGLIGSDFGAAQTDTTNKANADELSSQIEASDERFQNMRTAIFTQIEDNAQKETDRRIAASSKGADAKIAEINGRPARAQADALTAVKAMISQGVTDSTNPIYSDTINKIASTTGLTTDQVNGIFNDTKKTSDTAATAAKLAAAQAAEAEAKAKTAGQVTLSPGQVLIGPDGKVIQKIDPASKYNAVSATLTDAYGNQTQSVRIFDTTTGKFVNGGGGGGGGTGGGGTPPVTLPAPQGSGASAAPAAATNNKVDSHQAVAQTVNGVTYDKNGDPTSGNPAANAGVDNKVAPFAQYGLLSKTDFQPKNMNDQLAQLYLDKYIKSGQVPTASTMGRNIKPGLMAAITSRAQDLYFKATGNPLPNPTIIKAQQDIIAGNYKLGNNLALQEQTVSANVDLNLKNMTKAGLNSSGFKPLDELIDNVKGALQDPNVGQFIAQNATIQNELGSLLAVKNAGGTTVYDKLTSAGIIGSGDSAAVIKQKVSGLLQEAGNFAKALTNANQTAYGFTDPLMMDVNNPARDTYLNPKAPTTDNSQTPAGGSAITAPDGTQVIITD